jgi:hypothetical protein
MALRSFAAWPGVVVALAGIADANAIAPAVVATAARRVA